MLLLIENPSTERLFCVYDDSLRRRGGESSQPCYILQSADQAADRLWPPSLFPLTDSPPPRRLSVLDTLRVSLMTSEGRWKRISTIPVFQVWRRTFIN